VQEILAVQTAVSGMDKAGPDWAPASLTVFDLACGNLRFEAFLSAALPETALTFYTVDNCTELVSEKAERGFLPATARSDAAATAVLKHQDLDVLDLVCRGVDVHGHFQAPPCDLAVAFGFLHHVPTVEYREKVLLSLVEQARPGGCVLVSFWQFAQEKGLAEKALATHGRALAELQLPPLDAGDYLLGWQDSTGAYRYCHSFTDAEVDHLIDGLAGKARLVARFKADGRTDALNSYLVLQVN
jgi:SAM-dependent methyltransferase